MSHPRQPSPTGIFHVTQRGVNCQDLFFDDADRRKYCKLLFRLLSEMSFTLHAYCLMSDHVHLLLSENADQSVSAFMQRINIRYARYYNEKYGRIGPVFNERFCSKAVGNEAYYRYVMHYICQNPVKAGICKMASDYPWSSLQYLGSPGTMIDSSEVRRNSQMELHALYCYLNEERDLPQDVPFESEMPARLLTDEHAIAIFRRVTGLESPTDFAHISREKRILVLRSMIESHCSLRQIARVVGISRTQIAQLLA